LGRFVGLDYGRARIGISLSDERKILASPLLALEVPRKPELLLKALEKTLSPYYPIELFVIGFPLLMNGKEGEMALEVRAFANNLTSHFSVPHVLWDERLSSLQVDRVLKEAALTRKQRSGKVDALAATLILQNYLETKSLRPE
jgi:putative Holliday junction resolvase